MNEISKPWGIATKNNTAGFKQVQFSVYPCDPTKIYCRCLTDSNEYVWMHITDIKKFNETLSGYSDAAFKNNINYLIRYLIESHF